MAFETLHSETIYRGKVFNIHKDQVQYPEGKIITLDVVEHAPAVTLIPLDEDGRIWFVKQYRHPAGVELLELPAGVVEQGEEPEQCALREVREETGMAAGSILKIGEFLMAPGYSTERMHVYLAKDLTPGPLQQDEDEFLSVEQIPASQAYEIAYQGGIQDSKTLAALFLAQPYLSDLSGKR